jgi:hypothetical protein
MRVVIKPLGIVLILVCLISLAGLAVFRGSQPSKSAASAGGTTDTASTEAALPLVKGAIVISDVNAWRLQGPQASTGTLSVLTQPDAPTADKQVLHIALTCPVQEEGWAVQLAQYIPSEVPSGQKFRCHFWARSKTKNKAYLVYEMAKKPYTKDFKQEFLLTPEWKEYNVIMTTHQAYPARGSSVKYQVAFGPGEIEINGFEVKEAGQ